MLYVCVFAGSTIMAVFYRFSEERLRLLWREWLTRILMNGYLSGHTYYRLKTREEVDNPDQRITEDVKSYTQTTLSFFLMSLELHDHVAGVPRRPLVDHAVAGPRRHRLRGGRLRRDDPPGPSAGAR